MKSYILKAQALFESTTLDNHLALSLEAITKGLEIEPENEECKALQKEVKAYHEKEQAYPAEEKTQEQVLVKWLRENGAIFDKLKLTYFAPGYRGVMAARDIKVGETVLFIPEKLLIFSPQLMTELQVFVHQNSIIPQTLHIWDTIMLQLFMMDESKNPESFYRPYLNMMPKDCSTFPVCFEDEEFKLLNGSPLQQQYQV